MLLPPALCSQSSPSSLDQNGRTGAATCEEIWDYLSSVPDSGIDEALDVLMWSLQEMADADDISWLGFQGPGLLLPGSNEPKICQSGHAMEGWDALARRQINSDPERIAIAEDVIASAAQIPSLTSQALVKSVGSFRIHRLRDGFIDFEAYEQTEHFDLLYRKADIRDRIYVGHPVEMGAESFLLIDRKGRDDYFTEKNVSDIENLLRPMGWLHRKVMKAHGIIGSTGVFDAMERRIFRLLLTSRGEPEIAETLGQAPKTTHKYVTSLFRKMGVQGRPGFFARWAGSD
ncbi:MAG: hypothetical protein P1U68_05885 [Verrucomicrobiales bacterium]|nr:hypothetical protein [Verrucomicrobiales bacterium]